MAKGWDGWQVKTRIYNFLAGPPHAQPHQSTAATLQRWKKFEKYCLEEQREVGQALQFPGAKAFGGFTIKSFLFASFATERSFDKRGKTIKVRINSAQVTNKIL